MTLSNLTSFLAVIPAKAGTQRLSSSARNGSERQGHWIDSLHPQAALRAIHSANVRSGILPSQSAFAGMTAKSVAAVEIVQ